MGRVGFCKLFVNSWDAKWRLIFPGTMISTCVVAYRLSLPILEHTRRNSMYTFPEL